MSEPVRTCVGCGTRALQADLVRFTAAGGLALDGRTRAPGRGAYLHRDTACWTAFVRRRGAVRSLRTTPGPGERERLVATLSAPPAGVAAR